MIRHQYENPGYRRGSQDQSDHSIMSRRDIPNPDGNPKPPVIGRRKEALLNAQNRGGSSSSFTRTRNIKSVPDLDLYPTRDVPFVSAPTTPAKQTYLWDDFLRDTPQSTRWTDMSHTCYDYPTMDSSTPDTPWSNGFSPNRSAPAVLDSSPARYSNLRNQNRSLPLLDTLGRPKPSHTSSEDVLSDNDVIETNQSTMSSNKEKYDLNQSVVSHRSINMDIPSTRGNMNRSTVGSPSTTLQTTSYGTTPRHRTTSPINRSLGSTSPPKSLEETDSSANSKTPIHKQNGLLPSLSRRSLNLSKPSLIDPRVTLYGNGYGIPKSIASLALMGTTSLITAIFGLLLMFQLTARNKMFMLQAALDNSSHNSALEVAVALTSFVIMLDLCCMTVCAVQCFFTAKLLKVPQGEERYKRLWIN